MRRRRPTAVLALVVAGGAVANFSARSVVLGPEQSLGAPAAVPARHDGRVAMASDGTGALLAWHADDTTDTLDVFVRRVDAQGVPLDPAAVRLAGGPATARDPRVSWDGTQYWVTWWDNRHTTGELYGARVTTAGQVLDPDGVRLTPGARVVSWSLHASASAAGTTVVTWEDARAGAPDVYAARVGSDGVLLDPVGLALATGAGNQSAPAIASDGAQFFVAWVTQTAPASPGVVGLRLATTGLAVGGTMNLSGFGNLVRQPAVAGAPGAGFLVTWIDDRVLGNRGDVYAARVTSAGQNLDTAGLVVSAGPQRHADPAAVSLAQGWLVAWSDERAQLDEPDVYGARIDPAGAVLDPAGVALASGARAQQHPALARTATSVVLAFQDTLTLRAWNGLLASFHHHSRLQALSATGVPQGTAAPVATRPAAQRTPRLASNGSGHLLVYWDDRDGTPELFASRVAPDGTLLDPGGLALSSSGGLAWSGPAVAASGEEYLVAWSQWLGPIQHLYGARVTTSGVVLDVPPRLLVSTGLEKIYPSLAAGDGGYLLTWIEELEDDYWRFNLLASRLTLSGVPLDPNGVVIFREPDTSASVSIGQPQVVATPSGFSVAWTRETASGVGLGVQALLLDGGLATPTPLLVATSGRLGMDPVSLAVRGEALDVTWVDRRAPDGGVEVRTAAVEAGQALPVEGAVIATRARVTGLWTTQVDGGLLVAFSSGQPAQAQVEFASLEAGSWQTIPAGTTASELSLVMTGPTTAVLAAERLAAFPSGESWRVFTRRVEWRERSDAGAPDAGEPDAGEPDAGEPDAGEPDAGEPDAGEPPDAADQPDGGDPHREARGYGVSCGCAAALDGGSALLLFALALAGRRRHPHRRD